MFVNEFRTEVSLTLSLQTNYLMFSGMQVIIFLSKTSQQELFLNYDEMRNSIFQMICGMQN